MAVHRRQQAPGSERRAEPHAGSGQVVVEVRAAGVCHSDVTALDDAGWIPPFPVLPCTMGHENAVITQVGEGMNEWKVATVSAWHPR
jgi:propanol-preferring alcohol dehydrogenase